MECHRIEIINLPSTKQNATCNKTEYSYSASSEKSEVLPLQTLYINKEIGFKTIQKESQVISIG